MQESSCERVATNLHMAESCGWKLFTSATLISSVISLYIYVYIRSVFVDLYTRRRSEKIRSLFIFLSAGYRGWTIGSSFYEPNPFWDKQNVLILIVFFFIFVSCKKEREREIGLTFVSFIKWFHAYSTYCRRGKAVPSFLILFVIPADDHGWFSPVF